MANELTSAERETLNSAAAIIIAHTPLKTSWSISAQNFHGNPSVDPTYFDTNFEQHSAHAGKIIRGETFADRIQCGIDIQARVDDDADGYKARRIAQLQAELAKLADAA